MGEKNDKKQRKYWNDHLRDMYLNEDGKYSYGGSFREIKGDGKAISRRAWLFVAIMDVLMVLSGLFPASGAMDAWYVILPHGAAIIFCGFLTFYMFKWTIKGPSKLREYIYQKTIPRLYPSAMGASILSFLVVLTESFYLTRHGMGMYPKGAIILLICAVITGATGQFLCSSLKRQEWLNIAK